MAAANEKGYTYADYLTWDDGRRYELIDGEVYMMSPAPSRLHQEISGELLHQLANYLVGKPAKVYAAPFDVRLDAETDDGTVVQPDLSVICDPAKLDDHGCNGAPDLIIEILSPSTAQRDQVTKFNKYLASGVREYWVVYPEARSVLVYLAEGGQYVSHAYADTDTVAVAVLDECEIRLAEVFPPSEAAEPAAGPDMGQENG